MSIIYDYSVLINRYFFADNISFSHSSALEGFICEAEELGRTPSGHVTEVTMKLINAVVCIVEWDGINSVSAIKGIIPSGVRV
jgi:hypothetical protein